MHQYKDLKKIWKKERENLKIRGIQMLHKYFVFDSKEKSKSFNTMNDDI